MSSFHLSSIDEAENSAAPSIFSAHPAPQQVLALRTAFGATKLDFVDPDIFRLAFTPAQSIISSSLEFEVVGLEKPAYSCDEVIASFDNHVRGLPSIWECIEFLKQQPDVQDNYPVIVLCPLQNNCRVILRLWSEKGKRKIGIVLGSEFETCYGFLRVKQR